MSTDYSGAPPCPSCGNGKLYNAEARQRGYCGMCKCRNDGRTGPRTCPGCPTMREVQPCFPGCGVTR
jgi:hypothetical protein